MSLIDDVVRTCGWKFKAISEMPKSLLDIFYPDFLIALEDILPVNMNLVSRFHTSKNPENMEIWYYSFSFKNFGAEDINARRSPGGKKRPVVIFRNDNLGDFVIRIGTPKKKNNLHYKRLGVHLENWEELGLTKDCYIMPNIIRPLEMERLDHKVGVLDNVHYELMLQGFIDTVLNDFQNPWEFIEWCKSMNVKDTIPVERNNNNYNKLQTVEDVKASRRANCVDIATVVHQLCHFKSLQLKHKIVIMNFQDKRFGGSWRGHVFCVVEYKGKCYAFRYIGQIQRGDVVTYDCDMETVIMQREHQWLLNHFRAEFQTKKVRTKVIIVEGNELKIWDDFVREKKRQVDLLSYIEARHQKEGSVIIRESAFEN